MEIILPVAIGVLVGIAVVGILVRWLLNTYRTLTLGVLLGLLLGALFGLWPFKTPVPPEVGAVVRGVAIETPEEALAVETKYWPTVGFVPSSVQIGSACGLILLGAVISGAIGLLGGSEPPRSRPDPQDLPGAEPTS
jgi:putative membrane protein